MKSQYPLNVNSDRNLAELSSSMAGTDKPWTLLEVRYLLEGLLTLKFTDFEDFQSPPETHFTSIDPTRPSSKTNKRLKWLSGAISRRISPLQSIYQCRNQQSIYTKLYRLSNIIAAQIKRPSESSDVFELALERYHVDAHPKLLHNYNKDLCKKDSALWRLLCARQRRNLLHLTIEPKGDASEIDSLDLLLASIDSDSGSAIELAMVKEDLQRILSDTRDASIDNPIPIARRKLSEIDIERMNIDKEVIQGIIDSVSESIDRRPGNATVYLETDPPKALLEGLKKYLKLDFDGIIVPKQYKMDEEDDIDWSSYRSLNRPLIRFSRRTVVYRFLFSLIDSIYKIPKSFQYGAWYVSPPNWHDLQLKRQSSEKEKLTLPSSIRRRADVRKRISQLLIRSLVEHTNSESRHSNPINRNSMNGNKIRSSPVSSSVSKNQTTQLKRAQKQHQEPASANLPSIGAPSNDFRNTVLGHQPSEIDPLQVNIAEMVQKITGLDTSSWPNEHIVQPASKQTNHLYNFTSPTSVMNSSAGINSPDRNGGFLTNNNSSLSTKGLESLPDPGLSADVEDRLLKRYSHHLQQTEADASLSSNINLFGKSAIGLNKLMSSSMIGNWDSEENASAGKLASNMNLLSVRADSARKRVLINDGVNAREFRGNES